MRKLLLLCALATVSLMSAQTDYVSATDKGNFVVETAVLSNTSAPNTGLGYTSVQSGGKMLNVGVNGGYFVAKDFALKAGLGYGEMRFNKQSFAQTWSFRAGAEYHIASLFPLGVAWTGSSVQGAAYNPSYLSTDIGYNWYVSKNVAVKPMVRYDISLTDRYSDVLSLGVGFGYYF